MEDDANDHQDALEGDARELRREKICQPARDKEENPEPFPGQADIINDRSNGRCQVHDGHRPAGEEGMVQCDFNGAALHPECAQELVPEGGAVEDDHLPEQESIGPGWHRDVMSVRFGFYVMKRKGFDARSKHQNEADTAKQRIAAAQDHRVAFVEGEKQKHTDDGCDPGKNAEHHAGQSG